MGGFPIFYINKKSTMRTTDGAYNGRDSQLTVASVL
jgi:hypothetical protein